jgi:hypothetical protein
MNESRAESATMNVSKIVISSSDPIDKIKRIGDKRVSYYAEPYPSPTEGGHPLSFTKILFRSPPGFILISVNH